MRGTAQLHNGRAQVRLTDRLRGSGAVRYEARIRPARDAHPENNVGGTWVEVAGGPRALLLTNYPDDPLAALMSAQGLAVETVAAPGTLTPASLAGVRLVVIDNVPAHLVAAPFLAALDFFVREQGGGLLMAGGKNSFGSGGYFSSAIDPLLPVSMEMRKERRKLATAMAIVMDRSGSMNASAGNGLKKMDLADSGAARAIELLGDSDAVSVHAVDTEAHEIVGLATVGPNRERMIDAVKSVESAGGGIVVPAALQAAWEELKKATAGTRHIILFADANDSRQQLGDYEPLASAIHADGITISVIGLGTDQDHDADVLQRVAELGGGRAYCDADPADIPSIFAQETVSVARSTFVTDPTPAQGTAGWGSIAARTPKWPSAIDGYNLSYLKPEATQSLVTTDEYNAPLVATWARGAGRTGRGDVPPGRAVFGHRARVARLRRFSPDAHPLAGRRPHASRAGAAHEDRRRPTLARPALRRNLGDQNRREWPPGGDCRERRRPRARHGAPSPLVKAGARPVPHAVDVHARPDGARVVAGGRGDAHLRPARGGRLGGVELRPRAPAGVEAVGGPQRRRRTPRSRRDLGCPPREPRPPPAQPPPRPLVRLSP